MSTEMIARIEALAKQLNEVVGEDVSWCGIQPKFTDNLTAMQFSELAAHFGAEVRISLGAFETSIRIGAVTICVGTKHGSAKALDFDTKDLLRRAIEKEATA